MVDDEKVVECEDSKLKEDDVMIESSEKMDDGNCFERIKKKLIRSTKDGRVVVQRKSPRLMSIHEEDEEPDRVEEAEINEEEERVEEKEVEIRNIDDDDHDSLTKKRTRKVRAAKKQMNKRKAPIEVLKITYVFLHLVDHVSIK